MTHEYPDRMFINVYGVDQYGWVSAMFGGRCVSRIHTSGRTPEHRKRLIVRDSNVPVGSYRDDERIKLSAGALLAIEIPGHDAETVIYQPGTEMDIRL